MSSWWWLASWEGSSSNYSTSNTLDLEICIEIWIDDKYKMDALFSTPWRVNDSDPNQPETKFLVPRWSKNPEEKGKTTFILYHQKQTKPFRYLILLSFFVAFGAMSDFRSKISPFVLRLPRKLTIHSAGFPPSSATTAAGDDAPRCGAGARRAGAGNGQRHVDGGGGVFGGSRCDLFQIKNFGRWPK